MSETHKTRRLPPEKCAVCFGPVSFSHGHSAMATVELPQWGGGGNSTVTNLHQVHFQDILEKFENLVELAQLNHRGEGGGKLNHCISS